MIPLPGDAPKAGEVYRHYKKGDLYRVTGLALHANNEGEWLVLYEAMYENPAAPLFARPLREWREAMAWEGKTVQRFSLA